MNKTEMDFRVKGSRDTAVRKGTATPIQKLYKMKEDIIVKEKILGKRRYNEQRKQADLLAYEQAKETFKLTGKLK